jgi:membrane-bound metal-dependent hydrolase YbcI (DUF457 family)
VGATIPDILEPLMVLFFLPYYWDVRIVTHSLIGSFTVMLLAAVLISLFVVPAILRSLKKRFRDKRFHTFAGIDILEERGSMSVISYSALIGILSHVIIDIFYHESNPLFYPSGNIAILFYGDLLASRIIISPIIGGIFLILAYKFWWNHFSSEKKNII